MKIKLEKRFKVGQKNGERRLRGNLFLFFGQAEMLHFFAEAKGGVPCRKKECGWFRCLMI